MSCVVKATPRFTIGVTVLAGSPCKACAWHGQRFIIYFSSFLFYFIWAFEKNSKKLEKKRISGRWSVPIFSSSNLLLLSSPLLFDDHYIVRNFSLNQLSIIIVFSFLLSSSITNLHYCWVFFSWHQVHSSIILFFTATAYQTFTANYNRLADCYSSVWFSWG